MSLHLSEYLPASTVGGSLIALVFATTPSTVHLAKTNSFPSCSSSHEETGNNNNNNNNNNEQQGNDSSSASFPSSNENFTILSNTPALSGGAIVDIRAPQLPFAYDCAPSICSMWKSSGPRGRKCCALVALSENFDVHLMTCSLDGENVMVVFKHCLSGMSKWLGERNAAYPSPPNLEVYFTQQTTSSGGSNQQKTLEGAQSYNNEGSSPTSPSSSAKITSLFQAPLPRPAMSWFSPSTGALFFVPTVPKLCHSPEERIFWFPYTCLRRPVVSADGSSHMKMKKLYTNFGCPILYFTVSEDTDTTGGNEVIKFSIVSALSARHTVRFFCCPSIEVASALETKPNLKIPDPIILGDFSLVELLSPLSPNYHLSLPSFLNLEGFLSCHFASMMMAKSKSSNNNSNSNTNDVEHSIYNYAAKLFTSPVLDQFAGSTQTSSTTTNPSSGASTAISRGMLNPNTSLSEDQMIKLFGLLFSTSNSSRPDVFLSSLSSSIGPLTFMRIKSSPRGAAITRELSAAAFAWAANNPDDTSVSQGWAAQVVPEQFVGVGLCVCTDQLIHVLECFPKGGSSSPNTRGVGHFRKVESQKPKTDGNDNNNNKHQEVKILPPTPLFRYSIGGGLPLPHFLGVPFQLPEWANQRLVCDRTEMIHRGRLPASMLSGGQNDASSASSMAPPARRVMFVVSKSNDQTKSEKNSDSKNNSNDNNTKGKIVLHQPHYQPHHHAHDERNTSNWKYLCLSADNELHEALGVLVPFTGYPSAKILSRNSGQSRLQRILFAPLESLNSHDQQVLFMHTFDPKNDFHLLGNRHHYNSNVRIASSPTSEAHPRLDPQTGKIERPLHAAYLFLGKDLNLQSGQTAASRCVLFVGMSSMKVPLTVSQKQFTPSTNHFCIFARQMNELDPRLLQAQQEQAHLSLLHHDGENPNQSSLSSYFLGKKKGKSNSGGRRFSASEGDLEEDRKAAEIDATFPLGSDFYGKVDRAVVDLLSSNTIPFVQYEESRGSVTLLSVDVVDPLINVDNSGNNEDNNDDDNSTNNSSESKQVQHQCRTIFYFVRFSITEEGEDGSVKLGRECCLILVCSVVVHSAILIDDDQTLMSLDPALARERRHRLEKEFEQNSKPVSLSLKNGGKLNFTNPDFYVRSYMPTGAANNKQKNSSSDDDDDNNTDDDDRQQQSGKQLQLKFSLRLRRVINLSDVSVSITDHVASFKRTRPNKYFVNMMSGSSSPSEENNNNKQNSSGSAAPSAKAASSGASGKFSASSSNFPAWQVLDLRAFDASFVIPALKVETFPPGADDKLTNEPITKVKTDKVVEVPLSRLYASPWQDSFEDSIVKALSCCSTVSRVFLSSSPSSSASSSSTLASFSDLYKKRNVSSVAPSVFNSPLANPGATSSSSAQNHQIGSTLNFHQLFMYTVRNPNVVSSFPGTLVLAWSGTARCLLPMLTVHQRENGICCSYPFLLRHENLPHSGDGKKHVGFVRPFTFNLDGGENTKTSSSLVSSAANNNNSQRQQPKKKKEALNVFDIFADEINNAAAASSNNNNDNYSYQQPQFNLSSTTDNSKKRTISLTEKSDSFISLCSPTLFDQQQDNNNNNNHQIARSVSGNAILSDCAIIPAIFGDHSFAAVAATGSELSCVAFWGFSEASSSSSNINKMFLEDHVLDTFEKRRHSSKPISQQQGNYNQNNPSIDGHAQTVASLQETFRGEVKVLWTFDNNSTNRNTTNHQTTDQNHFYDAPIMQLTAGQSGGGTSSSADARGACEGPPALFVVVLLTNGIVRCHSLTTGATLWQLGTGASLPMIVRAESAASMTTGSSVCTLPDVIDFCGLSDAPSKSHWVLARIGSLFPSLNWRPEPASSVLFSWLEWIQWCVTAMATRSQRVRLLKDPLQASIQLGHQETGVNNNYKKKNRNKLRHVDPQNISAVAAAPVATAISKKPDLLDDMFSFGGQPSAEAAESSVAAATAAPQQNDLVNQEFTEESEEDDDDDERTQTTTPFEPPSSSKTSQFFISSGPDHEGQLRQEQQTTIDFDAEYYPASHQTNNNSNNTQTQKASEPLANNIVNEANNLFKNSQSVQKIFLRGLVATLRIAGESVNVINRSILNKCRVDDINPISPTLAQTKFFVVPSSVAAILATMSLPLTALALVESVFPSKMFSSAMLMMKQQNQKDDKSNNSSSSANIFQKLFSSTAPCFADFDTSPNTHVFCFATIAFWLEFHGQNEEATIVSLFVLKLLNEYARERDIEMVSTNDPKKPKLGVIDYGLSTLLLLTMPPNIASSLNLWNADFHSGDNFWNKYSILHSSLNRKNNNDDSSNVQGEKESSAPREDPQASRAIMMKAMSHDGVNHLWEALLLKNDPANIRMNYETRHGKQQQLLLNRFKTNVTKAFGTVTAAVIDATIKDVITQENNYRKNKKQMMSSSSSARGVKTNISLKEIAACGLQGSQFVADLDSRLLDEAINLDNKYQDAYELSKKKEEEFAIELSRRHPRGRKSGGHDDGNGGNDNDSGENKSSLTQAEAHAAFASSTFGNNSKKKKKNHHHHDDDEDDKMMAIGGAGGLSKIQIQIVEDKKTPDEENKGENNNFVQQQDNNNNSSTTANPIDRLNSTNLTIDGAVSTNQQNGLGASSFFNGNNINNNNTASGINNNNENASENYLEQRQFSAASIHNSDNNNNNNSKTNGGANNNTTTSSSSVIDLSPAAIEDQNIDHRVRKQVPHHDSAFSTEAENESRIPISPQIVKAAEGHLMTQDYSKVLQAASKLRNGPEIGDNSAMMQIFLVARVLKLAKLEKNAKDHVNMMNVSATPSKKSKGSDNNNNDDDDEASSSSSSSSNTMTSDNQSFGGMTMMPSIMKKEDVVIAADLIRITCLLNSSSLSNAVLFLLCEKLLPFYIEAKCGAAAVQLMSLYRLTIEGQIESEVLSDEEATQKSVKAEQEVGAIDGLNGGEFEEKLFEALNGKMTVCVDSLRMVESSKAMKCFKCMSLYQRHCVCV